MMSNRYVYEAAQAVFDEYAKTASNEYKRSYRFFKTMIGIYAVQECGRGDIARFKKNRDLYISRIWEDADVAFKGHGEPLWTGAVLQLWNAMPESNYSRFLSVVRHAFKEAEALTSDNATRRYPKSVRKKGYRTPKEGLDLDIIYPTDLNRLAEVSLESGYITEEELELYTSFLAEKELGSMKPQLQVIQGGSLKS